jgi:2-C-methyl-D-erythritol 4-phosphate cytidylyltransferase
VGVVIPAAGKGKRMGTAVSKQFLDLCGEPILIRTLRVISTHPAVKQTVVVGGCDELDRMESLLAAYGFNTEEIQTVVGGKERQQSVFEGLKQLTTEWVLVHDAVRPFITHDRITALLEGAKETGAAILAVPAKDTIKEVKAGVVSRTLERNRLWAVQTPQAFRRDLLLQAHQNANPNELATDDAKLVESLGVPVRVVEGDYANIKLTTPEDWVLADAIWRKRSTKS